MGVVRDADGVGVAGGPRSLAGRGVRAYDAAMPELTLVQFPGPAPLSVSPYCNKVHFTLRLKGLAYDVESIGSRGPGGVVVEDSTEIGYWLDARYPEVRLIPTDTAGAARMNLLEDWADEALVAACGYARSTNPKALRALAELVARGLKVPGFLDGVTTQVFASAAKKRYGHLLPLGDDVIRAQTERHFDTLDAFAREGAWLVGDEPTLADASVGAALHMLLVMGVETHALTRLRSREALWAWFVRFLDRVNVSQEGTSTAAGARAPSAGTEGTVGAAP